MELKPASLREVTWDDVKSQVKDVALDLFKAVEEMPLDASYKLYEASYPFGAMVLDENGDYNLPLADGSLVPFTSDRIPKEVKDELGYLYPGIPMGVVLQGQLQIYIDEGEVDSYSIFCQGDIIALNAALDLPTVYQFASYWRMTAGVRSTYMLASIADRNKFADLSSYYGLQEAIPTAQEHHWEIFRAIANSENFATNWQAKILFFSKKWFVNDDNHNKSFRLALLERLKDVSAMRRNYRPIQKIWREFSMFIRQRNKNVDAFILNMLQYIVDAILGNELSFAIADADNQSGPFVEIAKAIVQHYGLDKYTPVIMVPNIYQSEVNNFGYISIQLNPLNLHRNTKSKVYTLLSDFREMADTLLRFAEFVSSSVAKEAISYNVNQYDFAFYSCNKDKFGKVLDVTDIFRDDPRLDSFVKIGHNRIYSRNAFLQAAIKFSLK